MSGLLYPDRARGSIMEGSHTLSEPDAQGALKRKRLLDEKIVEHRTIRRLRIQLEREESTIESEIKHLGGHIESLEGTSESATPSCDITPRLDRNDDQPVSSSSSNQTTSQDKGKATKPTTTEDIIGATKPEDDEEIPKILPRQVDGGQILTGLQDALKALVVLANNHGFIKGGATAELGSSSSKTIRIDNLEMGFYQNLDIPDDEIELIEGEKEVLLGLAETLEENTDPAFEEARLISHVYFGLFLQTGAMEDVQKAIENATTSLAKAYPNSPDHESCLKNLIVMLMRKYYCTESLADLNTAIDHAEQMARQHPYELEAKLCDLAKMKFLKRTRTGSKHAYEKICLEIGQDPGPAAGPSGVEEKPTLVEVDGEKPEADSTKDLDTAILRAEQSITVGVDDCPMTRAQKLNGIVLLLQERFGRTGNLSDIDLAIQKSQQTVNLSPEPAAKAAAMNNLAQLFLSKFHHTDNLDDLQIAIQTSEEAVETMPDNHHNKTIAYFSLGKCLFYKSIRTNKPSDANASIHMARRSLETAGPDLDTTAQASLLADCIHVKFEHFGNLDEVDDAIRQLEDILRASPDSQARASLLRGISKLLRARFMRTFNLDDLHIAIRNYEEEIALFPSNRKDPILLTEMAQCFRFKFMSTSNPKDIDSAIEKGEAAAAVLPRSGYEAASILSNLALAFNDRYSVSGNQDDLLSAVKYFDQSLALLPMNDHNRAFILNGLALAYQQKYDHSNDLNDLDKHIRYAKDSVAATARNHRYMATHMYLLALGYERRLLRTGRASDLAMALKFFMQSVDSVNTQPTQQAMSARHAARLLVLGGRWAEMDRMATIVVDILPKLAHRHLGQTDRQKALRGFSGSAEMAACAAVEAGKGAYRAVELLELGRGIISGLRFGTRVGMTKLKLHNRELAERFERYRDVLDAPAPEILDPTAENSSLALQQTNRRHEANFGLNKTIDEIRSLPEFENFLRPAQADEMMAAASHGPIVFVNVCVLCHAFIIERNAIRSIPLPDLLEHDIDEKAKLLRSIRSSYKNSAEDIEQMFGILAWLWDAAVHPILNALGFLTTPENGELPRIWWIPTGKLSFLPLHAAGHHSASSTESALDKVVSSYSSSIQALLYSRRNAQEYPRSASGEALLVSMGQTPKQSDLDFAEKEVDMLQTLLENKIQTVKLNEPCTNEVVECLKTCKIFHFAGHGEANQTDPSKSSLLLKDWQANPLTVERLIQLDFRQSSPWLAYLSACSTSDGSARNLGDESMHVATACQIAGFQHVVGSLWEISDRHSVDAAEEIYKTIAGDLADGENRVALGVHRAAKRLRDSTLMRYRRRAANSRASDESAGRGLRQAKLVRQVPDDEDEHEVSDPLVWAAYIHIGL
ncbi:hypothetical protein DRE_04681 [Drechslerella stenobrocha 248]|uniref:CHAT domain-containing protein n=1 Tax=Drechslerella stenobrocha 248 TaxID=1043628 RepID=W7I0T3_9PEZI|nr:hypothetical protein DRE_04681 [Drechslerella stenobrocha 248]